MLKPIPAINKWGIPPLRIQVLTHLGGRCKKCGYRRDPRALQIDHVHGGGGKEKRSLGMDAMYRRILADTTGSYQLLCANCNWVKRWADGTHGGRPVVMPSDNAIADEATQVPA